jgi:muconolactone delta-isomerase
LQTTFVRERKGWDRVTPNKYPGIIRITYRRSGGYSNQNLLNISENEEVKITLKYSEFYSEVYPIIFIYA